MTMENKKGFSLVEMMVSVLIFTIIGGGLSSLLIVGTDAYQNYNAHILSQQEGRNTIAYMTRDLREANNIVLNQTESSVNLAFNHPVTGNITYTWSSDPGINVNRIIRQTPLVTQIIAKNISALNITNSTNDATVNVTSTVLSDKGRSNSFQVAKKIKKR